MTLANKITTLAILFVLPYTAQLHAKDNFNTEIIASGLGVPWGMTFIANDKLLISQRGAKISLLDLSSQQLTSITGLPEIKVEGQGGLFDIALSPDHQQTGWIFISYNKYINGQGATTLAKAKLINDKLTQWQDIFISQSRTKKSVHYGGRISFDDHGHVFLSIGDRGKRSNGQDLSNHAGSIVRLTLDGDTPLDNPFVEDSNALNEIWSYGHRNPQGLFFNTQSQQLWSIEHGPRGGDEINLVQAGNNYGWPVISYGKEYYAPLPVGKGTHRPGMQQPIKYYVPSIAPSSLIQYSGKAFPQWKNNLLIGALVLEHLNIVAVDEHVQASSEQRLFNELGRIRNVIESPQGWLYLATDRGQIVKVSPTTDNE
ncbi:dehydrogenase [Methylophaga sp. 41_12_T18]|nr:dehydrogenase [Methylophaga sp. 41_12_T18]